MSKLIHFEDQLRETSNPDPVLYWVERWVDGLAVEHFEIHKTKLGELHKDLVGAVFTKMSGKYPMFESTLEE